MQEIISHSWDYDTESKKLTFIINGKVIYSDEHERTEIFSLCVLFNFFISWAENDKD